MYLVLNGSDLVLFVTATFLQVSTNLLDRLEHKPVHIVWACVCVGGEMIIQLISTLATLLLLNTGDRNEGINHYIVEAVPFNHYP